MKQAVYFEDAKSYYVDKGLSPKAISGLLNNEVSERTIRNWAKDYNWDEAKKKKLNDSKSVQESLTALFFESVEKARVDPSKDNINNLVKLANLLKVVPEVKFPGDEQDTNQKRTLTKEKREFIEREILGIVRK